MFQKSSWRRMVSRFFAVALIASAGVYASSSPALANEALKKAIEELKKAFDAAEGNSKALEGLKTDENLEKLLPKLTKAAGTGTDAEILDTAKALANKLKGRKIEQFATYTELGTELDNLFGAILEFRGNDPARALEGPSLKMSEFITVSATREKLKATYPTSNLHDKWFAASEPRKLIQSVDEDATLATLMVEFEQQHFPATSIKRRAKSLTTFLTSLESGNVNANKKKIVLSDAELEGVLTKLVAAANGLKSVIEPRIHIVGAFYGDLRNDEDSYRRRCDATKAVRATCQAKGSCFGTDPSSINFDTDLCGYDPYKPNGTSRRKGLVVRYACISGDDNFWHSLAEDPRVGRYGPRIQLAVLRTGKQSLTCNFPPS